MSFASYDMCTGMLVTISSHVTYLYMFTSLIVTFSSEMVINFIGILKRYKREI